MRALIVNDGEILFDSTAPDPDPAPGETTVRVLKAGICSTDLALIRGYMGFSGIPGHEFIGVAEDGPLRGKRVVGEINAGCGKCDCCRNGDPRHCPTRTVLGILNRPGAFAEYLTLPTGNVLEVPESIPDEAATFTEPLAAAFAIAEQVHLEKGMTALVVGDGRLGCLCAQVLAHHGLDVALAGRHPERIQLMSNGVRPFPHDLHRPRPSDPRFDIAVEASGDPTTLTTCLPWVRPRGTVVIKTTSEATAPHDLTLAVINELTLVGSRCGRFAPALRALETREIDVARMVEGRYPLEDGRTAIERARKGGVLKLLLDVASP